MIGRYINIQILFRLVLVVLLSIAAGWLIATKQTLALIIIVLLVVIVLVYNLFHYLSSTNRKIGYFLESVQNEDSSLSFPTHIADKPVREIYQGLNKVNKQIQELRIEGKQPEQYFQTLLEHVATGIVSYNADGFVLHANTAAKKMLGLDVFTHLNQLERVNHSLFQAIRNIATTEQKLVSVNTERGVVQLLLKTTSFKAKDNELILLSIQDIRNELDEKELDSWMKLIRVLMHEIMNSIAPITSLSESLCSFFTVDGRPALPEELSESKIQSTLRGLSVIKEQGNGLMLFVESYRKLTRLPKPDRIIVKVDDLLSRIRVLYPSIENSDRVALAISINPPEMELYADENLIAQVLINLTKNAIQANEKNPEGKIQLIAGFTPENRPQIRVVDNGPGIPEDIIEQIFVPFFTTRENGSGIGLSLSRQIVRLHGGNLQVCSIPGKETVFVLNF